MLRYIDHKEMGRIQLGWLDSRFHFSFAQYYNPDNMNFGRLRVVNDDLVNPGTGFETHPHHDMEIISYVVDGELTHQDSMGNKRTLTRGQVQYMSAGTGVFHSEHNLGTQVLRFLQIWFPPNQKGLVPNYGDHEFNFEDRRDRWLPIVSDIENKASTAPVKFHADVNIYATILSKGKILDFEVLPSRQAYLVQIEGESDVNQVTLYQRDALEIIEEDITITATKESHLLIMEMAKE